MLEDNKVKYKRNREEELFLTLIFSFLIFYSYSKNIPYPIFQYPVNFRISSIILEHSAVDSPKTGNIHYKLL